MAIAMSMLGIWLLTAIQLCFVEAYPTGAPIEACETMIPSHASSAQTIDSLYDINLSSATYCPKKEVTVTIMGKSNNGEKFMGFLCQARTAVDTYETSGSLTSNMVTKNACSGKASLTHTDKTDKTSAVLKWTPNEGFTSPAFIVCTIVKERTTFWVKQNVELTYAGAANCTDDNMGVCNKDEDCSGMEGKQCVDGKCTSGAIRTALVSLMLMVVCFVLRHF